MIDMSTFNIRTVDGQEATVKALVLGANVESEPSQSLRVDSELSGVMKGNKFILPPEDPGIWAATLELNTRVARSVNIWARNTVGLGWKIQPRDQEGSIIDITDDKNKRFRSQYEKEKQALALLFKFPNDIMPFTRIMFLGKYDEEATGTGYIEVVRNKAGRITSLYHTPSVMTRVLEDETGFVQLKGAQLGIGRTEAGTLSTTVLASSRKMHARFFKNFGDIKPMDATTGDRRTRVARNKRATELLPFRLYTPRSSVYGIPRFVSAAPAISGTRAAAERNVVFFQNDACPRALLTVTGGKLEPESMERLENFFKFKAQGTENSGRLVILEVEPKKIGLGQVSTSSIEFQPLTVGINEDASFLSYMAHNNEEIREAFGLSEIFFRSDTVNRASGDRSMLMTEENEFEPDRVEKEFLINHTIVSDRNWNLRDGEGPGAEIASFMFKRPELLDPMEKAQVQTMHAALGVLTPNEIRAELGKDPYPEDFLFAKKPLVVALEELKVGLAIATRGNELPELPEEPTSASGEAGAALRRTKYVLPESTYLDLLNGLIRETQEFRAQRRRLKTMEKSAQ